MARLCLVNNWFKRLFYYCISKELLFESSGTYRIPPLAYLSSQKSIGSFGNRCQSSTYYVDVLEQRSILFLESREGLRRSTIQFALLCGKLILNFHEKSGNFSKLRRWNETLGSRFFNSLYYHSLPSKPQLSWTFIALHKYLLSICIKAVVTNVVDVSACHFSTPSSHHKMW